MRVIVDRGRCQTHGVCVEEAPEVFALEGEGLVVLEERPPVALREKLEAAAKYCPTRSIAIVDDD